MVGHTCTHDSQPMLSVNDSMVIPECEDIEMSVTCLYHSEDSSNQSDLDLNLRGTELDLMSAKSDAMDVNQKDDN